MERERWLDRMRGLLAQDCGYHHVVFTVPHELNELWRWNRICRRNRDVRIQSATKLFGIPLVSIAFGRDPERGETRGHAKGIFAFGGVATSPSGSRMTRSILGELRLAANPEGSVPTGTSRSRPH